MRWCQHLSIAALLVIPVAAHPRPTVHLPPLGAVKGNALSEADEFLGIPYGSAERFTPAVARTEPFATSPLEATYFGPACKQVLSSTKTYGAEHGCHVLNIWRPAGTARGAKLPVMMYVPGGENDFGEAEPYNASAMAAHQNAVITSINYRVGPFGFAALREDAKAGDATGNWALTDIQAALRFLRAHVAPFGGDEARLTLFGQSSGAGLALLHAVLPSSKGLFEGVLGQSGSFGAASLSRAAGTTAELAKNLNCSSKGYASTKACLLASSADELVYAQGVVCVTPNQCSADTSWSPTVDGVLLPESPGALLAKGEVNPVSVALGANTNDSYLFISTSGPLPRVEYVAELKAQAYGNASLAARLLALYPPHGGPFADNIDTKGWYSSDRNLCGLRRAAAQLAQARPTRGAVHLYRYNYWFQSNATCTAVANYHAPEYGSMHQDEVSFVFGQPIFMNLGFSNCSAPGWAGYSPTCLGCTFNPKEAAFAKTMGRLWTSFAAGKASEWPAFGASGGQNVLLQPTPLWLPGLPMVMRAEQTLGRAEQCEVWDEVAGWVETVEAKAAAQ